MKFRVVWVGSTSDIEFRDAVDRYLGRIRHFFPIEVIEVKPERGRRKRSDAEVVRAESERLLEAVPQRGRLVVLDERGKQLDSLKFAGWLETETNHNPHGISFVLGGDLGLDDTVRSRGDMVLGLGPMTLPHELARVILLEQIYRACTVMRNVRYHK